MQTRQSGCLLVPNCLPPTNFTIIIIIIIIVVIAAIVIVMIAGGKYLDCSAEIADLCHSVQYFNMPTVFGWLVATCYKCSYYISTFSNTSQHLSHILNCQQQVACNKSSFISERKMLVEYSCKISYSDHDIEIIS